MDHLYTCGITASNPTATPPRRERPSVVIDMHCHLVVTEAEALAKAQGPAKPEPAQRFASAESRQVSQTMLARTRDKITGVRERLAAMDAAGVDIQVVSPAPGHYCYWAEDEFARDNARRVNDRLAHLAQSHPDRLMAFGTVPLQAPALAVEELRRCVRELGMRGVEISSNVNGQELADPKFLPFFAAAEELGVVVFMHPSGFTEGGRLSDYHLNNVIGNPLDSTVALAHLIYSGALDKLPGLKLLVAHGGGLMPAYAGRYDHAFHAREDCCHCQHPPSHYLQRTFFDTVVFDPMQLRHLAERFGAGQLIAGTDFPYDMEESQLVDFVHRAGLGQAETQAILGLNAARLLGIDATEAMNRARAAAGAAAHGA